MNEIVAPNIKRIIKVKGLKQSVIADKAGYTENQFSAMLHGRKIIRDTDIIRITQALDIGVNELFERTDV